LRGKKIMKKLFEEAEMELISVEADIITSSGEVETETPEDSTLGSEA
jgi:hypothetical protein